MSTLLNIEGDQNYVDIIFGHPVCLTMWSPIMYFNKWIVMVIHYYNVCEI